MKVAPEAQRSSDQARVPTLGEVCREVIETRSQAIKTGNAVENLAAEMREMRRVQQRHHSRRVVNLSAALIAISVLACVALYLGYRRRLEQIAFQKEVLQRRHASSVSRLEELKAAGRERKAAEDRAFAFYRQMATGSTREALGSYEEVSRLPLSRVESAVFSDWVSKRRSQLAATAYNAGMKAVADKEWKEAVENFQDALTLAESPPHAASLQYYLGIALMKLGGYAEAAEALERALSAGAEASVSAETRFHLATVYAQLGRQEEAEEAYRQYIEAHPTTSYARLARRRLRK